MVKCGQPYGGTAVLNVSNLNERSARLVVSLPPDSALGNLKEAEMAKADSCSCNAFDERDRFLDSIGFPDYQSYLKSDLWEFIRSKLDAMPSSKHCIACKAGTGLLWHHRRYTPAVMVGNFAVMPGSYGFVVRLCCVCHKAVHFNSLGEFVQNMATVDARLKELVDWCKCGNLPEQFATIEGEPGTNWPWNTEGEDGTHKNDQA